MRSSLALSLLATTALLTMSYAIAGEKLHVQGKPENYDVGKTVRYAVWHDDDGWHLRTTTAKKQHHFRGAIHVKPGKMLSIDLVKLEGKGANKDRFAIGPEGHNILFDFATDEGEDGFDFKVGPEGKEITWLLEVGENKGGLKKDKERIFVGKKGEHPDENPFTTPAHPGKRGK